MADKFISFLNGCSATYQNATTSYYPTTGETMIPWDGSKYTGITEVYIEISYFYDATGCTPNNQTGVSTQLYDITNTTEIANFFDVTTDFELTRSSNIADSMPEGAANLEIRFYRSCGQYARMYSCRLVIIQEATVTPKTMIMIPIGAYSVSSSTSYTKLSGGFGTDYEKHFGWDEDNYATIDNVYFWVVGKADAASTAYFKLATPAGASSVGEISTASTTWTDVKSADISGSITDDVDYTTWIKNTTSRKIGHISKAFIIIELSPVTKYQGVQTINAVGYYTAATTDVEYGGFKSFYYDDWSGVTQTDIYEATMKHTGAITPSYTGLYDDASKIETLSNASVTYERERSSNTETITDDSELGTSVYIKAGGVGASYVGNCWLVQTVTDITAEEAVTTVIQLNIGNVWKGYVGMQLNIGDDWKAIPHVWLNKEDDWKVIY